MTAASARATTASTWRQVGRDRGGWITSGSTVSIFDQIHRRRRWSDRPERSEGFGDGRELDGNRQWGVPSCVGSRSVA